MPGRSSGGLEWYIARHYLSSRRGGRLLSFITWIALGGVTVGVSALVIVIGVMTGMQEDLMGKILESSPHVMVQQQGSSLRMDDWREVIASVLEVDGVAGAAPLVLTSVAVSRSGYTQPADLYGVSLDSEGPPVTEMDVMGMPTPSLRQYEMTGTFTTGMYDYDMKNIYVPLEASQDQLGILEGDRISMLAIRTDDPDQASVVARAIQDKLGFEFYAVSWSTTNRALFSALKLEKLAMGLILTLIVVVAAFNIVSTLIMGVVDRTREIGILKSMGMTDRRILRVFILQGLWIGVIGTVMGTTLGLSLAWLVDTFEIIRIPPDVYFVDRLPISIRVYDVARIVGVSILIALTATIYPALQASRLQPVDAIRHE